MEITNFLQVSVVGATFDGKGQFCLRKDDEEDDQAGIHLLLVHWSVLEHMVKVCDS